MSSLPLTAAEILTFKVTLSERNQQNLHFGHFWACIKFHFFFQIPPFLLKLLRLKHIFIFKNFTLVSQAVLGLGWSKVSKNAKFFKKTTMKIFPKNWKKICFQEFWIWGNQLFSFCFDTPLEDHFLRNFCLFFTWRFGWKIGVFWNFGSS